jgi:uncharacterized Zn finger protein (UPF0148 family)
MGFVKTGSSSYRAFCDRCGTEIVNIYVHDGKIYGSECIQKLGLVITKNTQTFRTPGEAAKKIEEEARIAKEDEDMPF